MKAVQRCSVKDDGGFGAAGRQLWVSSHFLVCTSKESVCFKEFWSSAQTQSLKWKVALHFRFVSLEIHSSCPCRWPLLSPGGHRGHSAEYIHKYNEISCTEADVLTSVTHVCWGVLGNSQKGPYVSRTVQAYRPALWTVALMDVTADQPFF